MEKKIIWKWRGSLIEEVKEFNYLGYMVSYNVKQDKAHKRKSEEGSGDFRASVEIR